MNASTKRPFFDAERAFDVQHNSCRRFLFRLQKRLIDLGNGVVLRPQVRCLKPRRGVPRADNGDQEASDQAGDVRTRQVGDPERGFEAAALE